MRPMMHEYVVMQRITRNAHVVVTGRFRKGSRWEADGRAMHDQLCGDVGYAGDRGRVISRVR